MTKRKDKTYQLPIRFNDRQQQKLDRWSDHLGCSKGEFIRRLVDAMPMPESEQISIEQAHTILKMLEQFRGNL